MKKMALKDTLRLSKCFQNTNFTKGSCLTGEFW